jgi:hypothetical protein
VDKDIEREDWIAHAREAGCRALILVRDLTDGVRFPVYVLKKQDPDRIVRYFISESKMKVLETIELEPCD